MKKITLLLASLLLLILAACGNQTNSQNKQSSSSSPSAVTTTSTKTKSYGHAVVIYYSLTNHTKQLAESIHKQVGGDIQVIQTKKPYATNYASTASTVQKQIDKGVLPTVKALHIDWTKYDTIFLGSPVWYGDLSLPMQAFLKDAKLPTNAHIAPFFTSGSSSPATALATEKKRLPSANFSKALHITNAQQSHYQAQVEQWLHRLTVK